MSDGQNEAGHSPGDNGHEPHTAESSTGPHPVPKRLRTPPPQVSGVVLVGMSVALWWPAFTLGAWGTLFFDQLLTVWAAASAGFIVILFQPKGFRHRFWKAAALLVPSLWLALAFTVGPGSGSSFIEVLTDILATVVALLGIPFTIWVLVRLMWPDFGRGLSRGKRWIAIAAIALVAVISFELGAHQSAFLTCSDFTISGNSEPPHCVK